MYGDLFLACCSHQTFTLFFVVLMHMVSHCSTDQQVALRDRTHAASLTAWETRAQALGATLVLFLCQLKRLYGAEQALYRSLFT